MKKLLFIIGTRPEAIKMAPVIQACLKDSTFFEVRVLTSGQHKELLNPIIDLFKIPVHYQLAIDNQKGMLGAFTAKLLIRLEQIFKEGRFDWVVVQGDTSTAFTGALAAFYSQIPLIHLEAGLRTWQRYSPYPEEMNRQMISRLATIHFAPTMSARDHLVEEGIEASSIYVTGNTGIDALLETAQLLSQKSSPSVKDLIKRLGHYPGKETPAIVVTIHRRENYGTRLDTICEALTNFSFHHSHRIYFPVHPNPNIASKVESRLGRLPNIHLLPPLPYDAFVWLLQQSFAILTDSGGIQEEAVTLGKQAIVLRDFTERQEGIEVDKLKLCAIDKNAIERALANLSTQSVEQQFIFGDGFAAERILKVLRQC